MKKYSSKTNNFFPSGIVWGGYLFLVISIAIIFVNPVVGSLFTLLALLVVTGNEGIVLDFDNRRIRFYWGIFGLKFGKWERLPELEKITITPVTYSRRATSYGGTVSVFRSKKYQVRLYYKDINDYILAYDGRIKKAKSRASELSKKLKLRLIDQTKTNGKPS